MTKNTKTTNTSSNNTRVRRTARTQTIFRNIRESIFHDSNTDPPLYLISDDNGNGNVNVAFTPRGILAPQFSNSEFGSLALVCPPTLRWLQVMSSNFQEYRILQASLKVIGCQGINSGQISVMTAKSPMDITGTFGMADGAGPSAKTFDIATLAHKEVSIPMSFDSAWKKVTTTLMTNGSNLPWMSGNTSQLVTVASIEDIAFSGMTAVCSQAISNSRLASFALVYDVEFRSVVSDIINK